ncbi:RNA-directed DNA polymerase, eukaryota [Tanacetum coccineum]
MGSYHSKEDEVKKISTSVFVTNFPDQMCAKDLWHTCKQYGQVVDAYIPNRRSKAGKRFGFVRFIKVFDEESLVNNLCTMWVGRHKLHANLPRFQREPLNKHSKSHNDNGVKRGNSGDAHNANEIDTVSTPALVLDDSCLNNKDYSLCLFGYSVMMEFQSEEAKKRFQVNMAMGTWFSHIQQASCDFTTDERVIWVEIEGIPIKMWSKNTFNRIASKWGVLLDVDDQEDECFHKVPGWVPDFVEDDDEDNKSDDGSHEVGSIAGDSKNIEDLKGDSDVDAVPDTNFEEESYKHNIEEDSVGQRVMQSEDPFNLYELLNKKREVDNNAPNSDGSLKYPPGYTPRDTKDDNGEYLAGRNKNRKESVGQEDANFGEKKADSKNITKNVAEESICSGHFKKSEIPRTGGSILQLIDDLVKVGQTIGYNMKDCRKNMEEIIESQGETKMVSIELFCIKRCWGNLSFDYVYSASVGNSGGILCVWDSNLFKKLNATVSDYFVIVRGDWVPNGKKLLLISVYAPQELTEKKMLWDYLSTVMSNWEGEVIIMGDFNEVHKKSERFGSVFNRKGADVFNIFISSAGLTEVPLGGCSFTWCHKSATKMSKLDRFLISDSLMCSCPNISSITLDRYLSDHCPILMREVFFDYGPVPFRFFHYWFELEGFDKFVEDSWKEAPITNSNALARMMKKLKYLKEKIRMWNKLYKEKSNNQKSSLKADLAKYDSLIDKGDGDGNVINRRSERSQLNIRGILVDGTWIEDPSLVKSEFLNHFKDRFNQPHDNRIRFDLNFMNKLKSDQIADLECDVSKEEIKREVWDCGIDKSPGPDGFTFGFYRRYWNLIESDVADAVNCFFHEGYFPKGGNSSFVTLIPKTHNANLVKDFRPISLIGSIYKIIAKILANRLVVVLGDLVNEIQSAFVADKQILDGPFILNELVQWCKKKKKQSLVFKVDFEKAYDSSLVIVNGSPTEEFQFYKGLKQGDPLSPFLFILVMESLHISFQRVVDAGLFKGIVLNPSLTPSYMFYADDAIFMGQWSESNIDTLVHVLECFYRASGLRINMTKSKLLGIAVEADKVDQAAMKIGCATLKIPFSYLGSKVGGLMSHKGGLGVSSLFALNRVVMFKWVGRFITQSSLWARVIKALHGVDGKIGKQARSNYLSIWLDIIQEVELFKSRGNDLVGLIHLNLVFALESHKHVDVASKLSHASLDFSFRRAPRGGVELMPFDQLKEKVEGCVLVNMKDR